MRRLFILLGSNTGNSLEILKKAQQALSTEIGTITQSSSIYISDAWGIEDQPAFYNQVIELSSPDDLHGEDILALTQHIEQKLGRTYQSRWSARAIDIDILYLDDIVIATEKLHIPHMYLSYRNFTLIPLCEIAPDFFHPVLHKTNLELLNTSTDTLTVCPYEE